MKEKNKARCFQQFKNKYIHYTEDIYYTYDDLKRIPNFDCYIVGSDQVWNFYGVPLVYTQKTVKAFFLDFGNLKTKRIAFAASFGNSEISTDFKNCIYPLISKFHYVSVREKNAKKILDEINIKSDWILDPIFLLNIKKYKEFFKKEKKEGHIFLYLLSNESDFSFIKLKKYANENNLKIVFVTGNHKLSFRQKEYPTIERWLELIYSAKLVVTNSFHCSAFSILFNIPFAIVPQVRDVNQNDRFDSLFEYFGLSSRYVVNNDYKGIDCSIDWKIINKKITENFDFIDSKFKNILN